MFAGEPEAYVGFAIFAAIIAFNVAMIYFAYRSQKVAEAVCRELVDQHWSELKMVGLHNGEGFLQRQAGDPGFTQ